jgi:hypothetical protein
MTRLSIDRNILLTMQSFLMTTIAFSIGMFVVRRDDTTVVYLLGWRDLMI